jgi:parallel beta-helix repeat protein
MWPLINREMPVRANLSARTWSVDDDGPADFNSIQAAIDNASSGDTIFVYNGTYYEHVFVNKTITLIGENNSFTIIDGNKTNNVVHIKADNVTVENFAIRNSGMYLYSGILVDHSIGNIIINNKVTYNYEGVKLTFSYNNVVHNNIISNSYDGIYTYSSDNNAFFNNVLSSNNYGGVYAYSSDNNIFFNSTINSNSYNGIYTYSSNNNIFSSNTILYNSYAGISLVYSDSNIVRDSMVSNGYDGIYTYSSNNNIFSNNTIGSNSYDGVYAYSSNSNTFSSNTIISNGNYGINFVLSSNNNTIYHNNFSNTLQVKSESKNFWDYDEEGNHWSNNSKQDLNSDGIGDTPYVIDAVNQDNYPLMGIFYNFSITEGKKIYSVTVISNSTISPFKFQIGAETGNKIIYFNTTDKDDTVGFCRVKIPTQFISYIDTVLVDGEEIVPTVLNISNETYVYLYFTYANRNQTITMISSNALRSYFELLDAFLKLQSDLHDLNETYYVLLGNNTILLYNYTQLKSSFDELNNSYQEHLLDYSEQIQNFRNLTYILVALTAILIAITVYLSKRSHANVPAKIRMVEEK